MDKYSKQKKINGYNLKKRIEEGKIIIPEPNKELLDEIASYKFSTPDIRNKITSIVNLIEIIEMGGVDREHVDKFIEASKRSVNILCDKEVFKNEGE